MAEISSAEMWTEDELRLIKNIRWVLEKKTRLESERSVSDGTAFEIISRVYPQEAGPFFQELAERLEALFQKQGGAETNSRLIDLLRELRAARKAGGDGPECLGPAFNAAADALPPGARVMRLRRKKPAAGPEMFNAQNTSAEQEKTEANLIAAIQNAMEGKAAAGDKKGTLTFGSDSLPLLQDLAREVAYVLRMHGQDRANPTLLRVARRIVRLKTDEWNDANALGNAFHAVAQKLTPPKDPRPDAFQNNNPFHGHGFKRWWKLKK